MYGLRMTRVESVERILHCTGELARQQMHAIAYLWHFSGGDGDFRFTLREYGPYSYELDDAIDDAFYLGRVSIHSRLVGSSICPVLAAKRGDMRGGKKCADNFGTKFEDVVSMAMEFDQGERLWLACTGAYLSRAVEDTEAGTRWENMVKIAAQSALGKGNSNEGEERHVIAVHEALKCLGELREKLGDKLPKMVRYHPTDALPLLGETRGHALT